MTQITASAAVRPAKKAQSMTKVQIAADPKAETRRIIDHCGLEWDDACLTHDKTDRAVISASNWQVRQPIYGTSVQRWRRYEKHLGSLIQGLEGNGTTADRTAGTAGS